MMLDRLFYYSSESRTGWRTFVRNGYLLAAIYVWASGVIFALTAPYALPVEAYLLTVWMAPAAFYWTPLFQRAVVDRFLLASPVEGTLPVRLFGFLIMLVPITGTLFIVFATASYLISRQRGRVRRVHRVMNAVREREGELLDEIAAMHVAGVKGAARDYLHAVMEEIHTTPFHPRETGYRKRVLADMETNREAIEGLEAVEDTA